jgi:hypothetical protein
MLTQSRCSRWFQATAIVTLGTAMLAISGISKANAANLQTFKISGTFAEKYLNPPSLRDSFSLVENGSFDGIYTVNVDQLPTTTSVNLENWDINLRDSQGDIRARFYSADPTLPPSANYANVDQSQISFGVGPSPSYSYYLSLFVNNDFTGTSIGRQSTVLDDGTTVSPHYGTYINNYNINRLLVTSFKSEPVPEPFTIGGTLVAGAMGLWIRRQSQKQQTES